jgi:glycosyltransferase involved in cell wall biosynthesis
MRIAVVGKKYPFCGIVTYCREQVRALSAGGHTVAFYYFHNEDAAFHEDSGEGQEDGLPIWFKTHMFTVPKPDARQVLFERLRAFRPDVVHASFALGPLDWALPELCAALDVPLVATFHVALDHRPTFPNHVSSLVYRLYAKTLSRCERVIVFSELQRERLARLGVAASRVAILPNGVDVTRYKPGHSHFRERIGARRLIGYMGRIDPEKNVGALLAAFEHAGLPPGTHLVIVGDGIRANRLRLKYADVPNVHWEGFVRDEERRIDILRGCDLFVLPSSVEGLSIALLEGMACGAVPVATDVGADGEVIEGVGRVIDPTRLSEELGPNISALLARPLELAWLREATRRRVVARYAFTRNVESLLGIYQAARASRNRALRR